MREAAAPGRPDRPVARWNEAAPAAIAASGRKVVALDDDPTGVQTVHDLAVLADWSVPMLATELARDRPAFFILTNSRSMPAPEARRVNAEIAHNLRVASRQADVDFVVASRSDSTLRGHFPDETDALAESLGSIDAVLICPAFFEGGRVTIDDVHYVRQGDRLAPASETEFARDAAFGYRSSNLRSWIEEKTGGRITADEVISISLDDIRIGGPECVAARLAAASRGRPIVVNAEAYDDLDVVVLGLLRREAAGQRFLYRCAASFVRARAGIAERPLLRRDEMLAPDAAPYEPGLVVVGSHTQRTSEQLERLLAAPRTTGIEVDAAGLLADRDQREQVVRDASRCVEASATSGSTPVLFTSRRVERPDGIAPLLASQAISSGLVEIVRRLRLHPAFIVAKGGITSSVIGTRALGVRRAEVLGQVRPGIPVWLLGAEARFPNMPYVIFPGNVGEVATLAEVVTDLRAERHGRQALNHH
ncbi:MAG TPA: four-carbon acid sugar kinase family protein [Thermomicrobiales bacterium]|nr:four-carbon acid sugar kinase family protein [Thermomicrobiales bacterium]